MVVGDFNNMLTSADRIGGNQVHIIEFEDLNNMMNETKLFEHDTRGNHFTWTNKQVQGLIYSRIDRAICIREWFVKYPDCEIEVLQAHI